MLHWQKHKVYELNDDLAIAQLCKPANCSHLQILKPLIIGFLVNVKEGALVLLTPSGDVPGLPARFTKRYKIFPHASIAKCNDCSHHMLAECFMALHDH